MSTKRAATLLSPAEVTRWQKETLTYPEVGHTAGRHPSGYHSFTKSVTLPAGQDLDATAGDLFRWQVPLRAGLSVAASSLTVEPGSVVVMRIGIAGLALAIPCRVVYRLDEPDRKGFAYGTLPGHPESGEEAFVLQRHPDGRLVFTVSAFSRPATKLAQLGGPLTTAVQRYMTSRYLEALIPAPGQVGG